LVDDDAEELHVQAVADSIRLALDDPNSTEDVERAISAVMGDEGGGGGEDKLDPTTS
jgi:hypothetical protein